MLWAHPEIDRDPAIDWHQHRGRQGPRRLNINARFAEGCVREHIWTPERGAADHRESFDLRRGAHRRFALHLGPDDAILRATQRPPPNRHKTRSGGIITDVVIFIIWLCVIGLIIGAIARLLLPGRDNIGILGTIALGILGSFVGGFLENLIEYHTANVHTFHATGLIGSVIGALVLLLLLRVTGLEPGHRRRRH